MGPSRNEPGNVVAIYFFSVKTLYSGDQTVKQAVLGDRRGMQVVRSRS